jgi:flavodoxin
MRILVAYESRGGHTKATAEAIAGIASTGRGEVEVRSIRGLPQWEVLGHDLVFLGTWVDGFVVAGVRPARLMRLWVDDLPDLQGTNVALFCSYAVNPRGMLDGFQGMLASKGGKVLTTQAFPRRHPDQEARGFVNRAFALARADAAGRQGWLAGPALRPRV